MTRLILAIPEAYRVARPIGYIFFTALIRLFLLNCYRYKIDVLKFILINQKYLFEVFNL